jgi:transposase
MRAKAVTLFQLSNERKIHGVRGLTWEEISRDAGPSVRSCKRYVRQWQQTGSLAPQPSCPNPTVKMGALELCFLYDLYSTNPNYQLSDYKWHMMAGLGVEIGEARLCKIFQTLRLSLKKPDVRRMERFYFRDGAPNWANINYWHAYVNAVQAVASECLVFFDEAALTSRSGRQCQNIAFPYFHSNEQVIEMLLNCAQVFATASACCAQILSRTHKRTESCCGWQCVVRIGRLQQDSFAPQF